jgi:hypothetical protein
MVWDCIYATGSRTTVTILLPGTCTLTLLPSVVSVASNLSQSCVLSVIQAVAAFAVRLLTLIVTVPAAVPPCMIWTAILPSRFLNALTFAPPGPPLAPTLTAPGRTFLLQFAKDQRRLLGMSDFLSSAIRMSLEFVAPPCTPIQYK